MTDYLLSVSGDDTDDGTTNPWITLDRASQEVLAAGDTLTLSGSSKTNPFRGTLYCKHAGDNDNRIQYTAASEQFILGSHNITEGAVFREQLEHIENRNWWFQDWTAGAPDSWTVTVSGVGSAVTEETSTNLVGASCAKLTRGSTGFAEVKQLILYLSNLETTLNILHNADANANLSVLVLNEASGNFLQDDGSWDTGSNYRTVTPVRSSWGVGQLSFTPEDVGRVRVFIRNDSSTGSDLLLQTVYPTYTSTWTASGNNYYTSVWKASVNTNPFAVGLWKCSTSDWNTSGIDALRPVPDGSVAGRADETELQEGEWWWDNTNKRIYYRPTSTEDITDLHLEFGSRQYCVNVTVDGVFLKNLSGYCAAGVCMRSTGANLKTENIKGIRGWKYGVVDEGAGTVVHTLAEALYNNDLEAETYASNGFLSNATANVTYRGCYAAFNGDDGFQNISTSIMTMEGCVSRDNLSAQATVTGEAYIYNSTFVETNVGDANPAIDDTALAGVTRVYKNNIVYYLDSFVGVDIDNASGASGSDNLWYEPNASSDTATEAAAFAGTADTDPLFQDLTNENYHLESNSPARYAGTIIRIGMKDRRGRVYHRTTPTKGAYEFTSGDPAQSRTAASARTAATSRSAASARTAR